MKEKNILNAWSLVTEFHSLKKLNFVPALFGTAWLVLVLTYQVIFALVFLLWWQDSALKVIIDFLHQDYVVLVVTTVSIIFFGFIILHAISIGGIIEMMDSYKKNNKSLLHRSWQGFFDGLSHFLPMFEIQNMTAIFHPVTIITFYIFLLRIFGDGFFWLITIIMSVYLVFSFLVNIFISYAPFCVVLENKRWIASLSASTEMAFRNIGITTRLYFTNFLLYFRVILVGWAFLLLPFVIVTGLTFFTVAFAKITFLIVLGIVSVILFIFITHLNSTLEIFVYALWHEAYITCKENDLLRKEEQEKLESTF